MDRNKGKHYHAFGGTTCETNRRLSAVFNLSRPLRRLSRHSAYIPPATYNSQNPYQCSYARPSTCYPPPPNLPYTCERSDHSHKQAVSHDYETVETRVLPLWSPTSVVPQDVPSSRKRWCTLPSRFLLSCKRAC